MIMSARLLRKSFSYITLIISLQSLSLLSHGAVVLQYHHIDTKTPFSTSTTPSLFKQHIEYLLSNDFTVLSLPDMVETLKANKSKPDKSVAITFDDGFISVYTEAFPILKKHQIPFTIFVNTDPIQAGRATHVSWEQLAEMKQHGATIANHTHSHSHLIYSEREAINSGKTDNITRDAWRQAFIDEIDTSQKLLKDKLDQDIKLFAYPYGEFDLQTNRLLKELGYIGFGQQSGAIGADMNMQSLPRYPASNQYGKFPLIATKLNSIAFKDIEFEPTFGVIRSETENPPSLYIRGDKPIINSINCFGSSVGVLPKIKVDDTTIMIKPEQPFTSRRFRYNCTAKSSNSGDFRWVSIPWVDLTKKAQQSQRRYP